MADVTKVKASDGTIYVINDVNDYTKDEVDALLANKTDVGVSYTKAEDDALLADKANASDVASEMALKANVVDVYSKTEADNLLAGKADTGVSYTKAEDDALLANKANSADVYTITQTDGLLADKAGIDDSSTTATMATWSASKLNVEFQGKADVGDSYTKAEDDALLATKGNMRFNTSTARYQYWDGTQWSGADAHYTVENTDGTTTVKQALDTIYSQFDAAGTIPSVHSKLVWVRSTGELAVMAIHDVYNGADYRYSALMRQSNGKIGGYDFILKNNDSDAWAVDSAGSNSYASTTDFVRLTLYV